MFVRHFDYKCAVEFVFQVQVCVYWSVFVKVFVSVLVLQSVYLYMYLVLV